MRDTKEHRLCFEKERKLKWSPKHVETSLWIQPGGSGLPFGMISSDAGTHCLPTVFDSEQCQMSTGKSE